MAASTSAETSPDNHSEAFPLRLERTDFSDKPPFIACCVLMMCGLGSLSFGVAVFARYGYLPCYGDGCRLTDAYLPFLLVAGAIRAAVLVIRRRRVTRRLKGYVEEAVEGALEATLGSAGIVIVAFLWQGGPGYEALGYDRALFLTDWLTACLVVVTFHLLLKWFLIRIRALGYDVKNVVLVGDYAMGGEFLRTLREHPETGYRVSAHLGREDYRDGVAFALRELVGRAPVDEIVLATTSIRRGELFELASTSELRRVPIRAVPELLGLPPAKVRLSEVAEYPLLTLLEDPVRGARRGMKRAVDISFALGGLILFSPIMIAAAIAVRCVSHDSILFRQMRVGMDGRPFTMLKFRTMSNDGGGVHREYVSAAIRGLGPVQQGRGVVMHKLAPDSLVTSVGRLLRRFSIDELPQLVNVIRGDMSLVGPRPALPYEVAVYEEWQKRRLDVRPGLSGLWQVSGRSQIPYDEMIRLDLRYIETWSLAGDMKIILRTPAALLRREAC